MKVRVAALVGGLSLLVAACAALSPVLAVAVLGAFLAAYGLLSDDGSGE